MNDGVCVFVYVSSILDNTLFQANIMREYISKLKSVAKYYPVTKIENFQSILQETINENFSKFIIAYYSEEEETKKIRNIIKKLSIKNVVFVDLYHEVFLPHSDEIDLANAKAIDIVRMAIFSIRNNPSSKYDEKLTNEKNIAIFGGGIAGITAAIELSKNNVNIYLIEKEKYLGGALNSLDKIYPLMCPAQCSLEFYLSMIEKRDNINVILDATVRKIQKYGNKYEIELITSSRTDNSIKITVGAIIIATGWKPFDPSILPNYQYGKYKNIVTNWEFEKKEIRKKLLKSREGKPFTVLFIQCVGSRDERFLPYCSNICCNITFKQVKYVKEEIPDAKIFISYIDLRTPHTYEAFYQSILKEFPDIILIRGKPGEITYNSLSEELEVYIEDTLRNKFWSLQPDLIVLAVGMLPNNREIANLLNIPLIENGYPQNHIQCNPYLSLREGVFFGGCSLSPMDISNSIISSLGAAMKAYTYINKTNDIIHALIDITKCDICKRCIEECPFQAIYLGEKGYPEVTPFGCEACGICMGACPQQAISLPTLSPTLVNGWISILSKSAQPKDQPLIIAFMCKNDAFPLLQKMVAHGFKYPANYRIIPVPCAGSVNPKWIAESLIKGIKGVLVIGCKESQCHYVKGSQLAQIRISNLKDYLENEIKMKGNNVLFANIGFEDEEFLAKLLLDFYNNIKN
jgi:heterodisulfide reductase subunit A-like polyferredoxin/coenzyme F420-reducing hydrogenase delta subunit